jgi:hypothetical protein
MTWEVTERSLTRPRWSYQFLEGGQSDSTAQFVAILTEAERRRQDHFIGLHAGELCEPRGPVAYLLMSHGHLADGLQSLARVALTVPPYSDA